MLKLRDGAAIFHIGGVASGAENAADFHGLIGVRGGNEGPGGVIYDGGKGNGKILSMRGQQEVTCSVSFSAPSS